MLVDVRTCAACCATCAAFHQQTVPCGLCPEGFASLWKRDKHRAEEHGQYDFVCEECGLKFFRRAELEIHTRRVHTLQLRYQCSACSHRSEERRKLLNHEHAAHGLHVAPLPAHNPAGQLGYPCPACRAVYGCGLAVKQHAWEQHQAPATLALPYRASHSTTQA
ncbi:myeloid zinc finger 1-like [Pollicipes pollicipes]|uniref:myeloid zinc finger 1-like n=1 Tax=Pollicipes pollicipes TaxID=41117 RepID=UPI001885A36D|nr:myeloid zinc finger 1-like [Pollicipes pollicipes]